MKKILVILSVTDFLKRTSKGYKNKKINKLHFVKIKLLLFKIHCLENKSAGQKVLSDFVCKYFCLAFIFNGYFQCLQGVLDDYFPERSEMFHCPLMCVVPTEKFALILILVPLSFYLLAF